MIIKKTYKFCLLLVDEYLQLCCQFAGACRWVFNHGLAARKEAWDNDKKSLSLFDQNKYLTTLKKQEATGWLQDIHSQVLQQALHDLDQAYKHFFRRIKRKEGKAGHPRFKCRGEHDSFRYPQGVKVVDNQVYLPCIGWVKFCKTREIQGQICQTTVIKKAKRWFVCFSCEQEVPDLVVKNPKKVAGIDVGIERFATIATEDDIEIIQNPKFLRKDLDHLRFLSRQLSKKHLKGKNWKKAKAKVQEFHEKIKNRRTDFLHKLSTQLVKSHDMLVVESLEIQKMIINASKALARSLSEVGWGMFLEMLKYKCEYLGKKFLKTARFFASSQICSSCGSKATMKLDCRRYSCGCGLEVHRDDNAAINIRAAGISALKACGAAL